MWSKTVFLILACILHSHSVLSIWSCSEDSECSLPSGSVCQAGMCVCPTNLQLVLGGTTCSRPAPYFTSPCMDDLQCTNLLTSFECRREAGVTTAEEGQCACKPGFHYLIGRCWKSADFGEVCERNEECFGTLRDPYNMECVEGRCGCSEGYYERQRGECRKMGQAVGDGCVLNEDCRFTNGACNPMTFLCIDSTSPTSYKTAARTNTRSNITSTSPLTRNHGNACGPENECPEPFLCSAFGSCVCPRGYYPNAAGTTCFAELGSTSTDAQCTGFLSEVIDGVCGCPPNVYFDENMRDCVKATRRITDSCVSDAMCHTFGAATICGEPHGWGFRNCECIPEQAVWDEEQNMCRLFAGVGEICQEDSDCLAGNLEILCIANEEGQGICTCPEGTSNIDGLCLTTGLSLGDECQMTQECTETEHTVCEEGRCTCGVGYQEREDICAPTIGSPCSVNDDCAIEHTVCFNNTDVLTCQCDNNFLEYSDVCWPVLPDYREECNVTLQCTELLGPGSNCTEANTCECSEDHHFRDDRCWPRTGLFESCSRSSECYLGEITHRVQCRNSVCQCAFEFPYSEEHHTCTGVNSHGSSPPGSSASVAVSSIFTIVVGLFYVTLH